MTYVYLVLAFIVVFAIYLWRHTSCRSPQLTDSDLTAEMHSRAISAVETAAKEHKIILDYSSNSVNVVEDILGTIHKRFNGKELSEEQVVRESLRWGGYIGEVIQRIKPCHWELNSRIGGDDSFPIVFEDEKHETFPVRWCYKRIKNGPEDNVWHKFTLLVEGNTNPLVNDTGEEPSGRAHNKAH